MNNKIFGMSADVSREDGALDVINGRAEPGGSAELPEAYRSLCARLDLNEGVPYTPQWSAEADFLELLADHVLTDKPRFIVECGSGLSSVVLARCCAINGGGRVYALENGADYLPNTWQYIVRYGLQPYASLVYAPLVPYELDGERYPWYALQDLPADSIDLLVVDGPPGFLRRHARYPALPLLGGRLRAGGTVLLDDAVRTDELELVARWLEMYPWLEHSYIDNTRGCARLLVGSQENS